MTATYRVSLGPIRYQVRQYRRDWAFSPVVGRLYRSEESALRAIRRDRVLWPDRGRDPKVRIVRVTWDPDRKCWSVPGCTCQPPEWWPCSACQRASDPMWYGFKSEE